jgi:phospholipase C
MMILSRSSLAVVALLNFVSWGVPSVQAESRSDAATPIRYLVVIFQENVSFDHYFATYPNATNPDGQPHFRAKDDTPSVNGFTDGLLFYNKNSRQPFRLDRSQAMTCDQDHDYLHEQQAMNHGLMDKFVEFTDVSDPTCDDGIGRGLVMGYYDGNTVTAFWNYAQHFAMSDNFYNTVFGPSTPGALNLIAGQTHPATVVRQPVTESDVIDDTIVGDPRPGFDDCVPASRGTVSMGGQNVGDLLNARDITWGWFQGGFAPSSRNPDGTPNCDTSHLNIAGATVTDYIPHHEPFQYYAGHANQSHLPASSVSMIGRTDQANHQYDLADFWSAVDAGNQPRVSFLKAAAYQDGHAGYSDPLDEQAFLVETINRLQRLPQWRHTAVIITYDDSDGWYDHAMPPILSQSQTSRDGLTGPGLCGTAPEKFGGRCGLGPRLPFLLVSPWAKKNFVDHSTTDQSSVLRFIEDNWRLGRLEGSSDALAGTLNTMFDFDDGPREDRLFLDPATGLRLHRGD